MKKLFTIFSINHLFFAVTFYICLIFLLASCGGSDDSNNDGDNSDGDSSDGDQMKTQSCSSDLIAPDEEYNFLGVLNFTIEGEDTTIQIAREPGKGDAVGETFAFHLMRFSLKNSEKDLCIDNTSQLAYTWGHHNWDETIEITDGDTRYIIRLVFQYLEESVWNDTIEAKSAKSGNTLWGPKKLVDAGCETLPPGNLNECMLRSRLDD